MKQDTRQKIIETGAEIIHHKGYHHTGIQEILKAAGVPKGSFYFYFDNKEDFGLQVIAYFNEMFREMVAPITGDSSLTPVDRIRRMLDFFIGLFTDMAFRCGCPIGNLSQEMGDLSPVFREKLAESVELMVDIYQDLLDQAMSGGLIPCHLDTRETADFIVSSWHGALIRMKIAESAAPLETHKAFILTLLQP